MFKSVNTEAIIAIAAAAFVASAAVFLIPVAQEANAAQQITGPLHPSIKGDRLPSRATVFPET